MFISAFEYADEYLQFVKAEEKIQVSEFPKEEAEQQQVTKGRRGRKRKFL